MILLNQIADFHARGTPCVLAAGFFDGVHMGHRRLLDATVACAREQGIAAWALTFARHPLTVLAPARAPRLLMSSERRYAALAASGLDGIFALDFSDTVAALTPEAFIQNILVSPSEVRGIFCGGNWRFGKAAAGNAAMLVAHGFSVTVVPYAEYARLPVSSTRIRHAVQAGRIEAAAAMLGHPYSITGRVVHGKGQGAEAMGIATANIIPSEAILPPCGVYAIHVTIDGVDFRGVANLGYAPTAGDAAWREPVLEVHLLNFHGNLYDQNITVFFHSFIRPERTFSTLQALRDQIAIDITCC